MIIQVLKGVSERDILRIVAAIRNNGDFFQKAKEEKERVLLIGEDIKPITVLKGKKPFAESSMSLDLVKAGMGL